MQDSPYPTHIGPPYDPRRAPHPHESQILQIISQASHEQLRQSGNHAFMAAFDALMHEQAKAKALENAFATLSRSIPQTAAQGTSSTNPFATSATRVTESPILTQKQYPHVRYWRQQYWTIEEAKASISTVPDKMACKRGGTRMKEGENVAMRFVEYENGQEVDGHRAKSIRAHARAIWNHMATQQKPHTAWGKTGQVEREYYHLEMEKAFPELRLCENHWKASRIATVYYTKWHANRKFSSSGTTVKVEDSKDDQDTPDNTTLIPRKRSRSASLLVLPPKRRKTAASPTDTSFSSSSISNRDTNTEDGFAPSSDHAAQPPLETSPSSNTATLTSPGPNNKPSEKALGKRKEEVREGSVVGYEGDEAMDSDNLRLEAVKEPELFDPLYVMFYYLSLIPPKASTCSRDMYSPPPLAPSSRLDLRAGTEPSKDASSTKPMRPTKTNTARNLYAIEYLKKHPKTTTAEFKIIWNELDLAVKKEYQPAATNTAKAENKKKGGKMGKRVSDAPGEVSV
ncbi:hypothetical protein HWV62_41609 [Athelia sp. TMB]|nr:hypothetical protein HWV62_41609 [Athelia sp. TMB]